jgi:hypothetical protein
VNGKWREKRKKRKKSFSDGDGETAILKKKIIVFGGDSNFLTKVEGDTDWII